MKTHWAEIEVALTEIGSTVTNQNHMIDSGKHNIHQATATLADVPAKYHRVIKDLETLARDNPEDHEIQAAHRRMTRLLAVCDEKRLRGERLKLAIVET